MHERTEIMTVQLPDGVDQIYLVIPAAPAIAQEECLQDRVRAGCECLGGR